MAGNTIYLVKLLFIYTKTHMGVGNGRGRNSEYQLQYLKHTIHYTGTTKYDP